MTAPADIWITKIDGSGTRVPIGPLNFNDIQTDQSGPAWSPDGARIAFTGKLAIGGPTGVWVISADGTNPVLLAQGGGVITWLPHENRVALYAKAASGP